MKESKEGRQLNFSFGDTGISVRWEGSRIEDWPHWLYESFLSSREPEIILHVHCTELPDHNARLLFDGQNRGHWKVFQNESGYILETFDTLTGEKNKVCFLNPQFNKADVYVLPFRFQRISRKNFFGRRPAWFLSQLMQPLGQIILMNLLAEQEGMMAHGLGVNDRGKGFVFLGGSGKGKSTMAAFWKEREGVSILSDEHILIRREKGRYWLYGTPWPGMANLVSSDKAPLERLFLIEHAPENTLLGAGTVRDLIPLLFLPFWESRRMKSVLDQCERLFEAFALEKLGFVKDPSVVDFIRRI